jgi:hypothetical protein
MTDEKPTGDAGASISERLEVILAAGDEQKPDEDKGSEAAPAPAVEVPEGDAPNEDEGPQYELSDIAKVLGFDESMLDVDEDGSLKVKTNINGQEGAAKLQDLVKSYQLQGHVDQKARQVAEMERVTVERVQQYEQFAQTKFQELEGLSQAAQQFLAGEYAAMDWDRLYNDDPIAFPKKQFEFQQRQGQIQNLLQQIDHQKQQVGEALRQHQTMELQRETQKLAHLVPEWRDAKTRETERGELTQWLQSKGASPKTIQSMNDAGLVAALREGLVALKSAPKVAAVEKKVRAAPKLVRPGQGIDAKTRAGESVRGLKQQIRESGGKKGIAEYLIATGKV